MNDIEVIVNEHSLLVSDSNETSQQFDSKQLEYSTIVQMFQEKLFKDHIGIMGKYMLNLVYDVQSKSISNQCNELENKWNSIEDTVVNNKLKVVPGQIILIRKNEVDSTQDLYEYIREHWNIPSGYNIVRIQDCMLRGVTEIQNSGIVNGNCKEIQISESNVPPHMHNSSITSGSGLTSVKNIGGNMDGESEYSTRYDMFNNESMSAGMDQNELNGTIDQFEVQENGRDAASHNNIPQCSLFYAFAIELPQ